MSYHSTSALLEIPKITFPIVLVHCEPLKKDNLSEKDKTALYYCRQCVLYSEVPLCAHMYVLTHGTHDIVHYMEPGRGYIHAACDHSLDLSLLATISDQVWEYWEQEQLVHYPRRPHPD